MQFQLNERQQCAVVHIDGPLLVLAGAGSGKTRVITCRIAHLIDNGIDPSSIMAVTFTNKAAREMRERAAQLVGSDLRRSWIGTFHALCARLLRIYGEPIGLRRDFVIYDAADQRTLADRVLKDLGVPQRLFGPSEVLGHIERAKNDGIGPADYQADCFFSDVVAKVYPEYERRLLRANAVDFGNLLLKTVELLRTHPELAAELSQRFGYLLVDEFQDTNHVQYEIVRYLSGEHHNLCVVGDDDQAIYSWRGANIRNILDFERDHPGATVIKLEQNYRSTQTVLDAAAAVIEPNLGRKAKRLWTERGSGEPIVFCGCSDERDEARFVVETIEHLRRSCDYVYGDFAVFYRTHAQSRVLEEALRAASPRPIPHVVVGGVRFYDRAEVKDLIAYLRLVANTDDDAALARIINVPSRGIGRTTVEKIAAEAKDRSSSLFAAAQSSANGKGAPLGAAARNKLAAFCALIDELRTARSDQSLAQLAELTLERTGYLERLGVDGSVEAQSRAENLMELLGSIRDYEQAAEEPSLLQFLEHVALASDVDSYSEDEGSVTLMTVHSAKGLEFPVVLIIGLEQGIFPHSRALSDFDQLEEERRLAYVAITRARQRLFLSNAARRWVFGQQQVNPPSQFLADIPQQLVIAQQRHPTGAITRGPGARRGPGPRRDEPRKERQPDEVWVDYDDDFAHDSPDESLGAGFFIGMRVRHTKFGVGIVRVITGNAPHLNLTVAFPSGPKTIRSQFVQPV
jgi:DNA helicase-2/ATP-dependent DNA helicase PcrA